MTSMQERADRIGASLTIVTAPRSGTEVVLAWEYRRVYQPRSMPSAEIVAPTTTASVLLVTTTPLLRTGVANINQEADLHVVAEAGNGVEAPKPGQFVPTSLLDLRMPVMEGVEVVRRLRERDPRARVIVLDLRYRRRDLARVESRREGVRAWDISPTTSSCIRDARRRPIWHPRRRPSSPRV